MKVIKKIVWIGERGNEGMIAFSFLFLQTFVVIWSELFRATEKMPNRPCLCLSQLTINHLARLDDARPRSVAIF